MSRVILAPRKLLYPGGTAFWGDGSFPAPHKTSLTGNFLCVGNFLCNFQAASYE